MKVIQNINNNDFLALSNYLIEEYDINISNVILDVSKYYSINESSNITYFELRRLIKYIAKYVKDIGTKNVLYSILDALTFLEIRRAPIPILLRQLKNSTKVFKDGSKK